MEVTVAHELEVSNFEDVIVDCEDLLYPYERLKYNNVAVLLMFLLGVSLSRPAQDRVVNPEYPGRLQSRTTVTAANFEVHTLPQGVNQLL